MSASRLARFALRRAAALAVLLVVVSFGVFALLTLAPGSPEQILLGTKPSSPELIEALRAQYHLDDPFLVRYLDWLAGAVRLDFGDSVRTGEPVTDAIGSHLEISVLLTAMASLAVLLAGVPLGVLAALRAGSTLDRAIVGLSVVGISAPAFATGILLLYLFAVVLGWFPAFGEGEGLGDRLYHLVLPVTALALTSIALVVRIARAAVISAAGQDYVTFARARGIGSRRVLIHYVLRNALISILTVAGLVFAVTLANAVLVEVTFSLSGLGSLLVDSVSAKDVPVVQGVVLVLAVLVVAVNFLVDVLYQVANPRVRLEGA